MRFQGLHFNDEALRLKVDGVLALCKKMRIDGPQRIDSPTWREMLGQNVDGKVLRQVFVKTHNGVSRGLCPQPAEWTVNPRAYRDLLAAYKYYLGEGSDLEEIYFEEERVRQASRTPTEAEYRALAHK